MKANNAENSAEQEKIKLRTTMIFTVPYKSWLCRMWPVNKDGNSKMEAPSKLKSNFLCHACKVKLWILTFWRWFCTMIFTLTYKSWLCRIWPVSEDGSMEQLQNRSPTFSAIHVHCTSKYWHCRQEKDISRLVVFHNFLIFCHEITSYFWQNNFFR